MVAHSHQLFHLAVIAAALVRLSPDCNLVASACDDADSWLLLQCVVVVYTCAFTEPGRWCFWSKRSDCFSGDCVAAQVHYKGLRVLLAWRDAQGGCFGPLQLSSSLLPPEGVLPVNGSLGGMNVSSSVF